MPPLDCVQRNVTLLYALMRRDSEDEGVADGSQIEPGARDGEVLKIGRRAVGQIGQSQICSRGVGDYHRGRGSRG